MNYGIEDLQNLRVYVVEGILILNMVFVEVEIQSMQMFMGLEEGELLEELILVLGEVVIQNIQKRKDFMILVYEVDGLFILRWGYEGVGVWNLRQDFEEGEKWSMDFVVDSIFIVGYVMGGIYLDFEEDVVLLLWRV